MNTKKTVLLITLILISLGFFLIIRVIDIHRKTKELKQRLTRLTPTSILLEREEEIPFFRKIIEKKPSLSDYEVILKNNPFVSRILVAQEEVDVEPLKFIYRGIVKVGDKLNFIIEDKIKKETFFLNLGGEIDGYRIRHIEQDSIILERGDQILELKRQIEEPSKEGKERNERKGEK